MSSVDPLDSQPTTHTNESRQNSDAHRDRVMVEFFLDEEASPIEAAVYYDADGPDEIEVLLGTFRTREHALLAVEEAKYILQRPRGHGRLRAALKEAQRAALQCPGNLGLPALVSESKSVEKPAVIPAKATKKRANLAAEVIASTQFAEQRKRAQRVVLTDKQVGSLLRKLIAAPGNRIDSPTAAAALGLQLVQLSGALPVAQRLLNVEQFPVLTRDSDGVTVVLDVALMKDQFGVSQ